MYRLERCSRRGSMRCGTEGVDQNQIRIRKIAVFGPGRFPRWTVTIPRWASIVHLGLLLGQPVQPTFAHVLIDYFAFALVQSISILVRVFRQTHDRSPAPHHPSSDTDTTSFPRRVVPYAIINAMHRGRSHIF